MEDTNNSGADQLESVQESFLRWNGRGRGAHKATIGRRISLIHYLILKIEIDLLYFFCNIFISKLIMIMIIGYSNDIYHKI